MILFTKHAKDKFRILERHAFVISKDQVVKTIESPDLIDYSRLPLLIAQKQIDDVHVLRVVYKQDGESKKIITFYPGRIRQYGKEKE